MVRVSAFTFTLLSLCAVVVCVLCSSSLAAQDRGYWTAASSNAKAITGDIAISATKVGINYIGFTIAPIRQLTPAEASAAFDVEENTGLGGELYRVNVPATRRFLHHNTLCGSEETQWMATYVSGHTLYVDFFSGAEMPKLTFDALTNSTDLCGTFVYAR